jgi:L-lysine exporter family protein LysE/ArgO
LITAGVAGFASLAGLLPWVGTAMRYGGAAFLGLYALRSLGAAFSTNAGLAPAERTEVSFGRTIASCLAVTWLNPHVYLDTVSLLGSVSAQYDGRRLPFALGAMTASFLFFFGLGYGARWLSPLFADPRSWRVLDGLIALTMAAIALSLVLEA